MKNVERLHLPPDKKLYAHQEKYINERNLDRDLLLHETGLGKTVTAICWMKLRPETKFIIACPNAIISKWKRDLKEWGAKADVISRDGIKKIDLKNYGGIILDEAHDYVSPAFTKQRSARTTAIYTYIRQHPSAYVLLLSATIIRSTSWNCHTAGCFLGHFWPVKDWQNKFFTLSDRYGRYHLEPTKNWRRDVRPYLESLAHIVLAKEVFDIPTQHEEIITIPWTEKQEQSLKGQYLEPMAEFVARRRAEQSEAKWIKLKEIIDGYRKVIVVVYFRDQIEDYVKRIGDDRKVLILHGGIKDQDAVIEEAKASDDVIFICQSSMGAGFDASEFSVEVFASLDYKYVSMVQMKGRIKRINNLHENKFIFLLGGKTDRAVFKTLEAGKDFDPMEYLRYNTTDERATGIDTGVEKERGVSDTQSFGVDEVPF